MSGKENEKFYELLKNFNTVMFITHNGESLHARPMAVADLEESYDLWFITDKQSVKVEELQEDPRAYVTCQEGRECLISLTGIAVSVQDPVKVQEIWREPFRVWFPEGPTDPSITLIRFTPVKGEYWDSSGINKAKYLFEAAKAYITGSRPEISEKDQHGTVKF